MKQATALQTSYLETCSSDGPEKWLPDGSGSSISVLAHVLIEEDLVSGQTRSEVSALHRTNI